MDAARPGQILKLTALRSGERVEVPVTVGRERYQTWHTFALGLGWSSHWDIWPTPNFNLLPIASFKRETKRLELNSPESILRRNARKKSSDTDEGGTGSREGWNAWLVLFGLGKHSTIMSQEVVEPLRAQR